MAFLFSKRKPFETSPVGERGRKAHEIIAEIYDLPIEQIMPEENMGLKNPFVKGRYSPIVHKTSLRSFNDAETREHELFHSVQYLLKPKKDRKDLDRVVSALKTKHSIYSPKVLLPVLHTRTIESSFEEPTAYSFFRRPLLNSVKAWNRKYAGLSIGLQSLSLVTNNTPLFIGGSVLFAHVIGLQAARHLAAKRFYDRHGVEGMLLLFTHPPVSNESVLIPLQERKLLKEGLLAKEGGLTQKGKRAILEAVPRDELLRRLETAKENREYFSGQT